MSPNPSALPSEWARLAGDREALGLVLRDLLGGFDLAGLASAFGLPADAVADIEGVVRALEGHPERLLALSGLVGAKATLLSALSQTLHELAVSELARTSLGILLAGDRVN